MKVFSIKPIWIEFSFLTILCLSACQSPGPTKPLPDPDTFDLPEVKVEVEMPQNIEDVDFILGLDITRIGLSISGEVEYTQADYIEVAVWGEKNMLYGINEEGDQIVVVDNGECVMNCTGEIGYLVKGTIDSDCILDLTITQIGKPATCTSPCAEGVTFDWYTGAGEFMLEPLKTDLAALTSGITRKETLGNMEWKATYTLTSFSGESDLEDCELDVTLP